MKKILSLLVLAVGSIGAAQAQSTAAPTPYYVGGNVGFSTLTGADSAVTEDNGASVSVYGGYQINETFAAEVGYAKLPSVGVQGAEGKPEVFTIQAVASHDLNEKVSVFGKAGLAHGELSINGDKSKGWSPMVGVGAEYSLTSNLSAVGEVSYIHDLAKTDAGAVTTSVGLKYRF